MFEMSGNRPSHVLADGDTGRRDIAERDRATIAATKTVDLKELLESLKPVWCTIRLFYTTKSTGVIYVCIAYSSKPQPLRRHRSYDTVGLPLHA